MVCSRQHDIVYGLVLDFILGVMDHREISHGNNETPTFQRPLSTGAVLRKGIELGRGADVVAVLALKYNVVMHKEPKHCVTELQFFSRYFKYI